MKTVLHRQSNMPFAVGAILPLLLLASCSTVNPSSGTGSSSTTPSPPSESPSAIEPCQTDQLSARLASGDAGAGHIASNYAFTNTSSIACTLFGYPKVKFKDVNGEQLKDIREVETEQTYLLDGQPPQPITLAPGEEASFQVEWVDMPVGQQSSCPTASEIQISLPESPQPFTLPASGMICGDQINVTPIQAGLILNG